VGHLGDTKRVKRSEREENALQLSTELLDRSANGLGAIVRIGNQARPGFFRETDLMTKMRHVDLLDFQAGKTVVMATMLLKTGRVNRVAGRVVPGSLCARWKKSRRAAWSRKKVVGPAWQNGVASKPSMHFE
jgi:hypothetical protein